MSKNFSISKHAIEQMAQREISDNVVMDICQNPDNILIQNELKVYQGIRLINGKSYLFRIFVNDAVEPNLIVTAYKTSKISKYYES